MLRCKIQKSILPIAIIVMAILIFSSASFAGDWISYAVKFTCGKRDKDILVVRGLYETSINIHNPHYMPSNGVIFYKKAVQARAQRSPLGRISKKVSEQLPPDRALCVDCRDIRNLFALDPAAVEANLDYFEGFLVIEIPPQLETPEGVPVAPELDVVGVYTARNLFGELAAGDSSNVDIESYYPKHIFGEPIPIDQ